MKVADSVHRRSRLLSHQGRSPSRKEHLVGLRQVTITEPVTCWTDGGGSVARRGHMPSPVGWAGSHRKLESQV